MSKLIFCTIALKILCDFQNVSSLRILGMFPFNIKSESLIQQAVMKSLAARGHQVDVYSHFRLEEPIANYKDVNLGGNLTLTENNMTLNSFSDHVTEDFLVSFLGIPQCNLMGLPAFQKLLQDPPKYNLVIIELAYANCYLALSKFLNATMIGITTTTTMVDWVHSYVGNPVNLATDARRFSHSIAPFSFFERLTNVLLFHYMSASASFHFKAQNAYVEKYFGPGYPDVQEMSRDLSLILLNHHSATHGNRAYAPMVIPIGGIHITDENKTLPGEVQKWMDEATSGFIYFTFGSMLKIETAPKNILEAFYEAFRNIAPVRILMKIVNVNDLPPGLPSNVMTQPWFSPAQILKHKNIKLFVTHGGALSTAEAVYYGVPMIGIPLFADQTFNIKNLVAKGSTIQIDADSITGELFRNAVTEVLSNPKYKKNALELGRRYRDRPMLPAETAVFWVEYVARNGKDALKPPSVDLPWWQNSLLDVYGFVLITTLLTGYIILKLLKCLLCCICFSKLQDKKFKTN